MYVYVCRKRPWFVLREKRLLPFQANPEISSQEPVSVYAQASSPFPNMLSTRLPLRTARIESRVSLSCFLVSTIVLPMLFLRTVGNQVPDWKG